MAPPLSAIEGLPTFEVNRGANKMSILPGPPIDDGMEPLATITPGATSTTLSVLPLKLVKKILELHFLDMAELLLDS